MKVAKFISYGQTESGDEMPFVLWSFEPTKEQMHAKYRELMPEEYVEEEDGEVFPCTNPRLCAIDVEDVE